MLYTGDIYHPQILNRNRKLENVELTSRKKLLKDLINFSIMRALFLFVKLILIFSTSNIHFCKYLCIISFIYEYN